MKRNRLTGCLLGVIILGVPGTALGQTQTYVDLQAGLGYSTNPLLAFGDNTDSAFGRVSAFAFHGWQSERGSTSLSAFVENSTYFRRYSSKQIFELAARTDYAVSERLRVFADAGFSGDFGGQLGTRFNSAPPEVVAPDPAIPDSFVISDPDLLGLNQRQYRLSGQVGASFVVSERDSMNVSAGAQHIFTGGSGGDLDYTQYDGSLGYQRQVNERIALGGRIIAQYSDYSNGRSVSSIGPQATIRARLSEQWDATAAVGFVHTDHNGEAGSDDSSKFDLALDASLCRTLEFERFCGRVARRTQSSILGGGSTSTSAAIDYYRRLTQKDSVQASASVVRSDGIRLLGLSQRSTFYTVAGSYDRMLGGRLSAGVTASARRLVRVGPDPKSDVGGSVYLRFRIGDIR